MWKISKKKLVIILVISVIVCFEVFSAFLELVDYAQKNVRDFITYANQDYGIKIGYPENWKLVEGENMIGFSPPWDVYIDMFPERFVISVIDVDYVQNLDVYAKIYPEVLEELLDDVTILELYRTTVDNYSAIKIVYTATYTEEYEQYNLKGMEVVVIRGKKLYHFVYLAEVDEYSDLLWIVELMIDKVDFIEG